MRFGIGVRLQFQRGLAKAEAKGRSRRELGRIAHHEVGTGPLILAGLSVCIWFVRPSSMIVPVNWAQRTWPKS
jgi:hypothetical protein